MWHDFGNHQYVEPAKSESRAVYAIPKLAYMVGGNNIIAGVRRAEIRRQLAGKGHIAVVH